MTPKRLISALRQFRHNSIDDDAFIAGYDYDEINKIFAEVEETIENWETLKKILDNKRHSVTFLSPFYPSGSQQVDYKPECTIVFQSFTEDNPSSPIENSTYASDSYSTCLQVLLEDINKEESDK